MDRLSQMPNEILLMILSHVPSMSDFRRVANLSRGLNNTLGRELYLEFGRRFDWLPLFVGAMRGDIKLLERCLDYGAPIDQVCTSDQVCQITLFSTSDKIDCWNLVYQFHRPIHTAIAHRQLDTVRWLLAHDADPGRPGYLRIPGDSFSTPLMWCLGMFESQLRMKDEVIRPIDFEIFRILLEAKAGPNVNDIKFGYPLCRVFSSYFAYNRYSFVYLSILLKYGADSKQLCMYRHVDHVCSLDSSHLKFQPQPNTNCIQHVNQARAKWWNEYLMVVKTSKDIQDLLSIEEFTLGVQCLSTIRDLQIIAESR